MAVFIELDPGDTLAIGPRTRVRLERKSGQRARLRIESDEDIERVKAGDEPPPMVAPPARPFLRRAGAA